MQNRGRPGRGCQPHPSRPWASRAGEARQSPSYPSRRLVPSAVLGQTEDGCPAGASNPELLRVDLRKCRLRSRTAGGPTTTTRQRRRSAPSRLPSSTSPKAASANAPRMDYSRRAVWRRRGDVVQPTHPRVSPQPGRASRDASSGAPPAAEMRSTAAARRRRPQGRGAPPLRPGLSARTATPSATAPVAAGSSHDVVAVALQEAGRPAGPRRLFGTPPRMNRPSRAAAALSSRKARSSRAGWTWQRRWASSLPHTRQRVAGARPDEHLAVAGTYHALLAAEGEADRAAQDAPALLLTGMQMRRKRAARLEPGIEDQIVTLRCEGIADLVNRVADRVGHDGVSLLSVTSG